MAEAAMIDPHWSVIDLDPRTWRNLGRFFDPGQYIRAAQPGEHGLFVLHEAGRLLRAVDTQRGVRCDLAIANCAEPRALAERLFATGEWQRVHVIDKRHLARVAREAPAEPRRDLTLDGYYRLVYQLLWDGSHGYVSVPPHPGHRHHLTYAALKQFVSGLPPESTLALGVFDDAGVAIGLVLELKDGRIVRVTTFEGLDLPEETMRLSPDFLAQLWSRLEERFSPPAGVVLCSQAAFEGWLAADLAGKGAFLHGALDQGEALWRLEVHGVTVKT
jgi:hypothetical protein